MNTIQYLDAVKARNHWQSDYKLAKELGISLSRMSAYRNGKNTLGEEICLQVADLLNIKPEIVLIDVLAERTKFPKVSKILHKTARQLTSAAASLLLTILVLNAVFYPADSMASGADAVSNTVYYVKWFSEWLSLTNSNKTLFFTLFLLNQLILRKLLHLWTKAKNQQ